MKKIAIQFVVTLVFLTGSAAFSNTNKSITIKEKYSGRSQIYTEVGNHVGHWQTGVLISTETASIYRDSEGYINYFAAGKMTVQFDESVTEAKALSMIQNMGSKIIKKQRTKGYYTISIPAHLTLFEAVEAYNNIPVVRFSEPSELIVENGPDSLVAVNQSTDITDKQWHLNNSGQNGPPGADIKAHKAWEVTRGSKDVVIAIIDSGVDLNHPDLINKLLPQPADADWNFENDSDKLPYESYDDHGTSAAGLAAAETGNKIGGDGVCPECLIMPIKINMLTGENQNRADAINYVVDYQLNHPHIRIVINLSWRMSSGDFQAVRAAVDRAAANNIPVIAASGNLAGAIDYPAKYASVIAIGASSPCDELKSWISCDGEDYWGSNFGPEQFIVAPGVFMGTTTVLGGYTLSFNGTSAAAPVVAGGVGLILSLNKNLTLENIREVLKATSDDAVGKVPDLIGHDEKMGWGRLNLERAVNFVKTYFPMAL
ncbi:MAG: S8 family serine peptidase [Bdellovibrionota bacterium]